MAGYIQIEPNEVYLSWLGGSEIIALNIENSRIGKGWEIDITTIYGVRYRLVRDMRTTRIY